MVTVGVAELERSLGFWTEVLGYQIVGRGPLPEALRAAWRVPPGVTGEVALLSADGSRLGMIRLVAFDPPGEPIWREQDLLGGNGFYAINLRARDVKALLPKILERGGRGRREPTFWEVSEEVAVWDSITRDPDGVHLDLFTYQRGGDKRGPLAGEVSVLQTIAIATHDIEASQAFYRSLGFEVLFDRVLHGMEALLGVPEGHSIRNVNLMKDGTVVPGRVEMFQYLEVAEGDRIDLARRAVPPSLGILSASFETSDLEASSDLLREAGAVVAAEPVEAELVGLGRGAVTTFIGPDGELLEVFELVR